MGRSSTGRLLALWAGVTVATLFPVVGRGDTGDISGGGAYLLSGVLELRGTLFDESGIPLGDSTVVDADGVMVILESDTAGDVDATTTLDGSYEFDGVAPGTYRARASVVPSAVQATSWVVVSNQDVAFPDVLVLMDSGTLLPAPNPFVGSLNVRFTVPVATAVNLSTRTVAASHVRTLVDSFLPPGLHVSSWDGLDDEGEQVAEGPYWVVLTMAGQPDQAGLVFRWGPTSTRASSFGKMKAAHR